MVNGKLGLAWAWWWVNEPQREGHGISQGSFHKRKAICTIVQMVIHTKAVEEQNKQSKL